MTEAEDILNERVKNAIIQLADSVVEMNEYLERMADALAKLNHKSVNDK